MLAKILKVLGCLMAIGGVFMVMGAVGADDYRVLQGMPGLAWGELIWRCGLGILLCVLSSIVWSISDGYKSK